MTNSALLQETIKDRGIKNKKLAELLGISPNSLHRKVLGRSDFWASEIQVLCKALGGLTASQFQQIFFAEDVDEKSTSRK